MAQVASSATTSGASAKNAKSIRTELFRPVDVVKIDLKIQNAR
jgi:hypothetical protein